MKYFLRVLLVLVVAVCGIYGVYQYNHTDHSLQTSITTATKAPATEKYGEKTLLASLDEHNIKLYKNNNVVILEQNGKEFEFENWSENIDLETPTLYYGNFDKDEDNEIAVRAVSEKNSNGGFVYNIYVLNPKKDSDGNLNYQVFAATRSTWSALIDEYLAIEVTQLKSCKKIGQFAMNYYNEGISYNKETGIMTKGHGGYFSVLQDGGDYLTIGGWSRGEGIYTVDEKNRIYLDIDVNVNYNSSSIIQNAGKIHLQLTFDENQGFSVLAKSLVFNATSEYKVSDPTKTSENAWSYVEKNAVKDATDKTTVSWINHTINYNPAITANTVSYASSGTDVNSIEKITLTDSGITLTAKKGCVFDESSIKSGDFSVIINSASKNEYNIAYMATIKQSGDRQSLTISFDKSYPQSDIKTVTVNYGVK